MARKRTASYDTLMPDPVYGSKLASKFMNCLMWGGKKATAQRIFYGALDQIKKRLPEANPIEVFQVAIENVKPPVELRWIITAARGKAGKPMAIRLADELLSAYRREGEAMNKRETTIKMADANK